ncbi:MAG TPA: hypothetical protein VMT50_11645 [Steroidobacteraceae bacterium]|nr:hypothetical protein [Steroidobacteraceae bacterium]
MIMIRPTWVSFGGTAAIVTGTSLVLGLDAAGSTRQSIASALLILALADNLTDSLSVHAYQESARLPEGDALHSTLFNFASRLVIALSFVALALLVPRPLLAPAAGAWGTLLLAALTFWLAREREAHVASEIGKHLMVAAVIVAISRGLGAWISASLG